MRVLGIDVGARRLGLAISDPTGMLARPLETVTVTSAADAVSIVTQTVERLAADDDGIAAIVVGMPARLDGTATHSTSRVAAFIEALRTRTRIPVLVEDERLTSVEAESVLARRERDWRKRKAKLDAAAATVILQDYLDRRHR